MGSAIAVAVSETPIALPNAQNLDGFVANAANTVFTVPQTGRYCINYDIKIMSVFMMRSELLVDGAIVSAATVNPVLSISKYNFQIILNLIAGDTISIRLSGLNVEATL
ncbi:BclA C-terminal domain-containing protein [Dehalobacterium formicoaceticum]|uniref:BclA C-terminal domain-containing protein n=1 Tax=Dehalobacterium formicoaceticum TaxID=51515 RepID=A0ABT1Y7N2_9FIRM|nr:hypothetical protein [Dehalobacterium formicoaceticum]MCR6546563.1 hypothetical protein [Dehalobacterium formicoaceticum]